MYVPRKWQNISPGMPTTATNTHISSYTALFLPRFPISRTRSKISAMTLNLLWVLSAWYGVVFLFVLHIESSWPLDGKKFSKRSATRYQQDEAWHSRLFRPWPAIHQITTAPMREEWPRFQPHRRCTCPLSLRIYTLFWFWCDVGSQCLQFPIHVLMVWTIRFIERITSGEVKSHRWTIPKFLVWWKRVRISLWGESSQVGCWERLVAVASMLMGQFFPSSCCFHISSDFTVI